MCIAIVSHFVVVSMCRILKDGTIFKGKFKNNKPLEGSFTFSKNGNVTTGKFDKHGFFTEDQASIQEETTAAVAQ